MTLDFLFSLGSEGPRCDMSGMLPSSPWAVGREMGFLAGDSYVTLRRKISKCLELKSLI